MKNPASDAIQVPYRNSAEVDQGRIDFRQKSLQDPLGRNGAVKMALRLFEEEKAQKLAPSAITHRCWRWLRWQND
jgi:hypothetical protein